MKKGKLFLLTLTLIPLSIGLTACKKDAEIGILQFGEFPALNKAREGFIDGLKEGGFGDKKINYQNAQGKAANVTSLAKSMVAKHDLNLAIATPCATAMKAAQENTGNTKPLLFTAVTDPVASGLLTNKQQPEGFVTGSSDMQPNEALTQQIALVKKMIPDASKLGIFYCASETNSIVQAQKAEEIAVSLGLQVEVKTCTDSNNIKAVIMSLMDDVDAIWIPTDDTVANNIGKVKEAIGDKKVLVISGEEGMLSGCHVSISIDYYELGKKTAELACQILSGKEIKDLPVYYASLSDCSYVYNKDNLEANGFDVSDLPNEYTWTNVA